MDTTRLEVMILYIIDNAPMYRTFKESDPVRFKSAVAKLRGMTLEKIHEDYYTLLKEVRTGEVPGADLPNELPLLADMELFGASYVAPELRPDFDDWIKDQHEQHINPPTTA